MSITFNNTNMNDTNGHTISKREIGFEPTVTAVDAESTNGVNGHADTGVDPDSKPEIDSTAKTTPASPSHPDPIPLWINGQETSTATSLPITAPSTGKIIHHYYSASTADCIAAIDSASAAFPSWSATPAQARRNILLRAADIFDSYKEEHIATMMAETGETRDFIQEGIDTDLTAEFLRDTAGRIVGVQGGIIVPGLDPSRSAMMVKEPYGVCFGMAPWNMPHLLGMRAFLGAIAVGNTAVLKGSEMSPKCHWQLGRVLREAGLPDGVLNIVVTSKEDSPEAVRVMIEHPAVRHVNFTGSALVGRIVAGIAGKNLKPCLMELGGKAPAIVLEDADVQLAAEQCILGAFCHSGQICMSTERILVHKTIAEEFTAALKTAIKDMYPKENSVLASELGLSKSHQVVSKTIEQGAHLVHGSLDKPKKAGARMEPVIIGGVKKGMDLYYTESFGPTVSLFIVESDEEALAVANDTEYGLAASVFSKDLARAMRVAGKIESGAVHINSMSVHDDPCFPHGGVKDSGFGRFNGNLGLEGFMKTKLISWKA